MGTGEAFSCYDRKTVFNFSTSEWILVGIIFLLVVAAPRVGRLGELIATGFSGQEGGAGKRVETGEGQDGGSSPG